MAAEESSQGAALGPEFSDPTGGDPPAKTDIPDLHDVLGEFMTALCVVEMVYRTLWEMMEESSERAGSCAIALRHGFEMLDTVYNRFDEGLRNYDGPGGNGPDDPDDEPDDDTVEDPSPNDDERDDPVRSCTRGTRDRLSLVARNGASANVWSFILATRKRSLRIHAARWRAAHPRLPEMFADQR
jgi:hypothetical protein